MENKNPRSRVGRWWQTPEGATRCELHVPLGHAAAVMIDQDGEAFEVENVRVYEAGPGIGPLYWIEPGSERRVQVGDNLLAVTATNPEIHVDAENLRSCVRNASRGFDAAARWLAPDNGEYVNGGILETDNPVTLETVATA